MASLRDDGFHLSNFDCEDVTGVIAKNHALCAMMEVVIDMIWNRVAGDRNRGVARPSF
jgi:hypothetical protein